MGQLDTRSGVKDVLVDTQGRDNVILGVVNPQGTFLNAPLTLKDAANLFLLSPGGLWLGQGGRFNRVPNLLLSTGAALDFPGGRFDAIQSARSQLMDLGTGPTLRFDAVATPAGQGLVIGARGAGELVIDRALLSLAGGLIVESPTSSLTVRQSQLRAGSALRLSGQGFALTDSSLSVGQPGRRGPIDVRSSQDPLSGAFGRGLIERVQMSGNQINISAGGLLLRDSTISAPKGWVELQNTNPLGAASDLSLIRTSIILNPELAADASNPLILRRLHQKGGEEEIRNPIPHIGLFSQGNIQIEGSLLDASMLLSSEIEPAKYKILEVLPERAGVILAEATGHLSINASTLRADASHTLSGYMLMEAGKDLPGAVSLGELRVQSSELSAGHGAGDGRILLQSDDGLAVVNSRLKAITDRSPAVDAFRSGNDWSPAFRGGQITLYNQSTSKGLLVSSSTLVAHHHTSAGPLSSPFLGGAPQNNPFGTIEFGTFGKEPGWTPGVNPFTSGGYVQLYSKGGIRIEANSRLDVSSFDPLTGQLDAIGGTIPMLNLGPSTIEIEDSRLDGRTGSGHQIGLLALQGGAVIINGGGDIRMRDVNIDLTTSDPGIESVTKPFLGISTSGKLTIAGDSAQVLPEGSDYDVSLWDSYISANAEQKAQPELLTNIFTEKVKYNGNILFQKDRSGESIVRDFQEKYVDVYRFIFEKAFVGLAAARTAWPLPLSSPPPGDLIPREMSRPPTSLIQAAAQAADNQSVAAQQLAEGQQQALADAVASFGLSQTSGRVRSVAELQQRLNRARQLSSSRPVSIQPSYRPAIVQLTLAELPGDQVQLKAILLLAEGQPLSFSQVLPAERVKGAIRGFQSQMSRQEPFDPVTGPGALLSGWLLRPLADALRDSGANALVLAVDRGLQGIPYGALPFGDQPLAERFALSVSPSLGLLDLDAERGPVDGQLLAAGASRFQQSLDPLPMVPRELAALAREQSATLLLDEQFTVDALRQLAWQNRFRQLHIATHAEFQPGHDDMAKLYTLRDSISLTTLRNMLRSRSRDQPMDLITLSACHTALGDEQSELGFVGMALLAGSRSAIGTLWEVGDAAAAAFFIQYYRYLRGGLGKDQALQATARAFRKGSVRLEGDGLIGPSVSKEGDAMLLRVDSPEDRRRLSEGLRHPHFWAGMVLTGSPW
ncbi:MAG: CHAT domain-containing protein [Cyanobacteriota bacterium]